jgi:hypothetical protein
MSFKHDSHSLNLYQYLEDITNQLYQIKHQKF